MRVFLKHLGKYIFRGFLAIIPLGLSFLFIRFLYIAVDTRVTKITSRVIGLNVPGLGIVLVLILLYLLGLVASNWIGKRVFVLIEQVTRRIPLIKTIYTLGKQLADAFSLPEKQGLKRAVMVEHFKQGVWSVGFVTSAITDRERQEEKMVRVFIPTAPNPTTGFVVVVKESQVRDLDWSVTEAMNSIISGGIVGPKEI